MPHSGLDEVKHLRAEMDIDYSGESHCSFATPKKQNNTPTLQKTPGRRKLALDDENEDGSVPEKKGQSRSAGGGLRQFSVMVCQKLEAKKITTYKEVADEIISDLAATQSSTPGPLDEFNEKNIRRRVYDALNVFMALDIITRDKKEIRWKGLPVTCKKDVEEVKAQRAKLMNSVEKKAAYLKELEEKVSGLQHLISRNQQMIKNTKGPAEGFTLPFIVVQTSPHATVEVEISEDMQLVHFDFNSTPFSLHDDAYILKLMHQHKLQQSMLHLSQQSSAQSSSSSCVARWNSYTKSIDYQ